MEVLNAIFDALASGVTAFAKVMQNAFTGAVALIWDSTASGLTVFGTILLITLIISLVLFAINFIVKLVNRRK